MTSHNAANPGSDGGGLMKHHTEVDDAYPAGETRTLTRGARTRNGDNSVEPPNRFVLYLSSIDESSEHEVHYGVDDIPVGTRGILRDHLAATCAHELHLTQLEWDTGTTFLTTLSQPRRTDKEKSS